MREELKPCPFCGGKCRMDTSPLFGSDCMTEYSRVICENGHMLDCLSDTLKSARYMEHPCPNRRGQARPDRA